MDDLDRASKADVQKRVRLVVLQAGRALGSFLGLGLCLSFSSGPLTGVGEDKAAH